jgi:hypothetical protein
MSRRPSKLNNEVMHCKGGAKKHPKRYKFNSCLSSKYLDYKAIRPLKVVKTLKIALNCKL